MSQNTQETDILADIIDKVKAWVQDFWPQEQAVAWVPDSEE